MAILEQFSLQGKTAIVTGATRGIGQAIALGLAEAGAQVVGVGSKPDAPETRSRSCSPGTGTGWRKSPNAPDITTFGIFRCCLKPVWGLPRSGISKTQERWTPLIDSALM